MSQTSVQTLGKYELLEKVGEGGMSVVYRGRHARNGRIVAVKVAMPHVSENPIQRQRFEQEYRVASKLSHPAIVEAIDFGEANGQLFIVMEFVDGLDLWQRIVNAGRLPEAEAVRLIAQVADALHEAHQQGVIHRDVKPDNILLTSDGRAKLSDLGLVKDLDVDLDLTRTRRGLGTPNFMAPEQFSNAKYVGAVSDLYSLGATLYMAVTGDMPFQGKSVGAIMKKKINNELTPPRQLVRSISERVDIAIRRSLRADPKQRHASCLEFKRALLEGVDETQRPAANPALEPGDPLLFAPPSPEMERRAWVRYACKIETACNIHTSIHPTDLETRDCWRATIQNLSVKSVGLVVSRRFELDTVLNVTLESRNRSFSRTLEMRVTRIGPGRGKQWVIGCRFAEELTKEELRKLL
jgi:serine/threonine protein kinase